MEVGPFDEDLTSVDDRDYWIRIALLGYSLVMVPQALAVLNTEGPRLSADRIKHDQLAVKMWTKHVERLPDSEMLRSALRASKEDLAFSTAMAYRKCSSLRRPLQVSRGLRISPNSRVVSRVVRATRTYQRFRRIFSVLFRNA